MVARAVLSTALLLSLASQAQALCRDDLHDLKPRIDHAKAASPERYRLALKWWGRAVEAEPGSEVECLNFAARARKALSEPLPELADCAGPNAYLPMCQNGLAQGGGGPALPIGVGAGLGGGGAAPFTPPGSVRSPSISSH